MLKLFNRNNKTHRDYRKDEFQILIDTNGLLYVSPKNFWLTKITGEKIRVIIASHSHACIWYAFKLNNKSKINKQNIFSMARMTFFSVLLLPAQESSCFPFPLKEKILVIQTTRMYNKELGYATDWDLACWSYFSEGKHVFSSKILTIKTE